MLPPLGKNRTSTDQKNFGQKVGMIYDSGSWEHESIYLTFLRKLDDGTWEKPSKGITRKNHDFLKQFNINSS